MTKELTSYDKFILQKMEREKEQPVAENSPYAEYLIHELKRTTPSDRKVMTETEFNEESRRSERVRPSRSGVAAKVKNGANIKKMGLIFLVFYVIIVIALALIVLVNANVNTAIPGADASAVDEDAIQAMPAEETESESGNWFDEFCDSLNK